MTEDQRLTIHCISLNDPTLTDDDLGLLFHGLPDPCMVLLEDIDATRFGKRKSRVKVNDVESEIVGGISLSGLLSALDEVATGAGVFVIMTTNHLEELDEALIRDDRIDMKIEFTRKG